MESTRYGVIRTWAMAALTGGPRGRVLVEGDRVQGASVARHAAAMMEEHAQGPSAQRR